MPQLKKALIAFVVGIAMVALAACGGGGSAPAASGGGSGPVTLEVNTPGENLAFEPAALSVTSGAEVTINYSNGSVAQQHNFVIVNGGDDVSAAVAQAGITAGASANYLPSDTSNIIASSTLANGGESVSVTFTAPAAGTYNFICTVPGHYPLMKGVLTVN